MSPSDEREATAPLVFRLVDLSPDALFVCLDRRVSSRMKLAEIGPPGAEWSGPIRLAHWAAEQAAAGLSVPDLKKAIPNLGDWGYDSLAAYAAILGGVVCASGRGVWSPSVDPGWLEERLALFDISPIGLHPGSTPPSGGDRLSHIGTALERRDHDAIAAAIAQDLAALRDRVEGEVGPYLQAVDDVHAVATIRGRPGASSMLVWHPPGQGKSDPATLVAARIKALGGRAVLARLDLLGLDVE